MSDTTTPNPDDPTDRTTVPDFDDPIERTSIRLVLNHHADHVECTEPRSEADLVGRGETATEAVRDYATKAAAGGEDD